MGQKYIEPPSFDLADSYKYSNCCSPLIFILSPGTDPMSSFIKFLEDRKMSRTNLITLSLGQGQVILIQTILKFINLHYYIFIFIFFFLYFNNQNIL